MRTLTLLVCISSLHAIAAEPLPPPPPPPPPPSSSDLPPPPPPPPPSSAPYEVCAPPCESGETCSGGRCIGPAGEVALPEGATRVNADGERAPAGQHWERRRRTGLLVTGPILLGVGWLGGALLGVMNTVVLNNNSTPSAYNLIPFAGPLIGELAYSRYAYSGSGNLLFAVVLTGLQIAGTLLTILGIPSREVLVDDERPYGRDPRAPPQQQQPQDSKLPPIQWSLAPGSPGSPLGISLTIRN